MIPGLGGAASMASGGGAQSLDLSAGPSTSGNIDQGFSFGAPTINNGGDWKQYAAIAGVVLAVAVLMRKK